MLNGVETIGEYCFFNSGLIKILIPSSLTTISSGAFSNCKELQILNFANNSCLKQILKEAFVECVKLKNIKLPKSVEIIGERCFALSGLTKIEIPNNVTMVENGAFQDCK